MSETGKTHPDETALIAWLDEPAGADPAVGRHVAECGACADRVASLEAVLREVAAEPALPDDAALAAARERIRTAIGAPADAAPEERVRRLPAWAVWAPALAAAALAAVLLWSPGGEEPPAAGTPTPGADASVATAPAAAEGEAAAEAVVAEVASGPVEDTAIDLDDAALESLAEIEETTPTLSDEDDYGSTTLADEFASLPEEDRTAILDELSDLTFDL